MITQFIYYKDNKIIGTNGFNRTVHLIHEVDSIIESFKKITKIDKVRVTIHNQLLVKISLSYE